MLGNAWAVSTQIDIQVGEVARGSSRDRKNAHFMEVLASRWYNKYIHSGSIQNVFYEMSYQTNVLSMKCPINEMSLK